DGCNATNYTGFFIYNLTGTRHFACARLDVSQPALLLHNLRACSMCRTLRNSNLLMI
ncbi:hypothetical protein L9F63_023224, partial [Diploptera punctata]